MTRRRTGAERLRGAGRLVLPPLGRDTLPPDLRALILCSALQGLAMSGFSGYVAIWAVQRLGAGAAAVGVALFLRALAGVGAGYLGGRVSDRRGRRPVILASWAAQAGCVLAFAFVGRQVWAGLGLLVAFGPLGPPGNAAAAALVADLVPGAERAAAYASMRVLRSMAVILGPPGAALLVAVGGWGVMFGGLAAVSAGAVVVSAVVLPGRASDQARDRASGPIPDQPPAGAGSEAPAPAHVLPLHRDRTFLGLLTAVTLITLTLAATDRFLPIAAVTSYHLPPSAWGPIVMLNPLLILLLQAPLTRAADRRPRPAVVLLSAALTGFPFLLFLLDTGTATIATVMVLATLGEILWTPAAQALAADLAPDARRGAYLGAFDGAVSVAYAVGPMLALEIHAAVGDAPVWWTFAAVAVAGAAFGVRVGRAGSAERRPPGRVRDDPGRQDGGRRRPAAGDHQVAGRGELVE